MYVQITTTLLYLCNKATELNKKNILLQKELALN